jgi:hypothetical protein
MKERDPSMNECHIRSIRVAFALCQLLEVHRPIELSLPGFAQLRIPLPLLDYGTTVLLVKFIGDGLVNK